MKRCACAQLLTVQTMMSLTLSSQVIGLTPEQSVLIHGWFKPYRYLHWAHIVGDKAITLEKLLRAGISVEDLHYLQGDVMEWVRHGKVGFGDVHRMAIWPLHPIQHLGGSLMNLLEQHYPAMLLRQLGITYNVLRTDLGMKAEHMPVLKLTLDEWRMLGMPKTALLEIPNDILVKMFQKNRDVLLFEWITE